MGHSSTALMKCRRHSSGRFLVLTFAVAKNDEENASRLNCLEEFPTVDPP